jgi:hypothetical protein
VYQSIDTTVRGVGISFVAEGTTIVTDSNSGWTLEVNASASKEVLALGGTQIGNTWMYAPTFEGVAEVLLLQETGNDIEMYWRAYLTHGATWQQATDIV